MQTVMVPLAHNPLRWDPHNGDCISICPRSFEFTALFSQTVGSCCQSTKEKEEKRERKKREENHNRFFNSNLGDCILCVCVYVCVCVCVCVRACVRACVCACVCV